MAVNVLRLCSFFLSACPCETKVIKIPRQPSPVQIILHQKYLECLKCGAEDGCRKSVGPIVREMKYCM